MMNASAMNYTSATSYLNVDKPEKDAEMERRGSSLNVLMDKSKERSSE